VFARRALRTDAQAPSVTASTASATQVASQAAKSTCWLARTAAPMALTPMATCPHPGTAVNDRARSIVLRMKRRFSMASECSGRGTDPMGGKIGRRRGVVKYFAA
jgi:hypothetical protein